MWLSCGVKCIFGSYVVVETNNKISGPSEEGHISSRGNLLWSIHYLNEFSKNHLLIIKKWQCKIRVTIVKWRQKMNDGVDGDCGSSLCLRLTQYVPFKSDVLYFPSLFSLIYNRGTTRFGVLRKQGRIQREAGGGACPSSWFRRARQTVFSIHTFFLSAPSELNPVYANVRRS